MARRGGLGKGLGALIPPGGTEGTAEPGGLDELPLASIKPNRFQPRDHFDEEALALLADSIREVGVLQPVLVRPVGDGEFELALRDGQYRLKVDRSDDYDTTWYPADPCSETNSFFLHAMLG